MIKRVIGIVILVVVIYSVNTEVLHAQDAQFTQFYSNRIYMNPAFAGAFPCPRFALNYRNEWPALNGTFVTYSAAYDQRSEMLQGGVGFLLTYDNAGKGTLFTTNFSGMYAYQININRKFSIRLGLEAGIHQKKLDWDKLVFGDQIDDRLGNTFFQPTQEFRPSSLTSVKPDFSAGILVFSELFFGGYSAHHLTQPNEGFGSGKSKLPMKHTFHAGAVFPFNDDNHTSFISPNIIYQAQGDFREMSIGLFIEEGPIVAGLWYRNRDAFIILVGIQTQAWRLGYTYDVTTSKLSIQNSNGSHEISFGMDFPCKPKKKSFRLVSCPSF